MSMEIAPSPIGLPIVAEFLAGTSDPAAGDPTAKPIESAAQIPDRVFAPHRRNSYGHQEFLTPG